MALYIDGVEYAEGEAIRSISLTFLDDVLLKLGTDSDQVLLNRSTTLTANTALANVLIGTPVSPALAANSLILSNITADGDILFAANDGGNSKGLIFLDGSAGTVNIPGVINLSGAVYCDAGPLRVNNDRRLAIGTAESWNMRFETADANANLVTLYCPEGGGTDVPVFVFGDATISGIDLGAAGIDFAGKTEPAYAVVNDAADAYASFDAGDINGSVAGLGLYFHPAADEDVNILLLSVGGTPSIIWDESLDQFAFSHGIDLVSGHIQLLEKAAPGAGAANTARIYALEGGGDALTDLCAVFQDGTIDVFAQESTDPDSPIFQFGDNTKLAFTMRKPDRKTIQFVATFPDGRDFVIREIRYPTDRWS